MVCLETKDKENITNMLPECKVYAEFPSTEDVNEVLETMEDFKMVCESNADM